MSKVTDRARRFTEEAMLATELAREVTPKIDERFLALGKKAIGQSQNPFFSIIDGETLLGEARPESVNHHLTLLHPNAHSTQEVSDQLAKVDLMLGAEATSLTEQFSAYAKEHSIFERLQATHKKPGEKFIVVSNHLELQDQGFTLGLWQKAGREQGYDRLENHLTVVVGRLIGYYQLGDENVVDDILRKAGSVLKTFPSGGTEAMSEDEQALSLFRKICNHRTKEAFKDLIEARQGQIICMAPSGEQDKFEPDTGAMTMRRFGEGTTEMMVDASQSGATILPLFVDYQLGANIARLLSPIEPGAVKNRDDCDEIGHRIATAGTGARGEARVTHPDVTRFRSDIRYSTA